MTTLPAYIGEAHNETGASSSTTYVTDFSGVDVRDGDYLVWAIQIQGNSGTLTTPPAGWALVASAPIVGSRMVLVYAKTWHTGDIKTISYVKSIAGAAADQVTVWRGVLSAAWGAGKTRAAIVPTTSFDNVAPTLTTTAPNTRVVALSLEATTAAETAGFVGGPTWLAGWIQATYKAQAATAETIAWAYHDMPAVGASGDAKATYQNTQATNGWAIQFALAPLPDVAPIIEWGDGAAMHDAALYWGDGASLQMLSELRNVGAGLGVTAALAKPHAIFGHRGASLDTPEGSLQAYTNALVWGADGFEVPVARTSDGVFFVLHDASLDRTSLGTPLDGTGTVMVASAMTWAQVQAQTIGAYETNNTGQARQPYLRLDALLAAYPSVAMLIDPKVIDPSNWAALLNLLMAQPNAADRFIGKAYYTAANWSTAVRARGLKALGYYYGTEIDANNAIVSSTQANWDVVAIDWNASGSAWGIINALNKPTLAHIVQTKANATAAFASGADGLIASGVREVLA